MMDFLRAALLVLKGLGVFVLLAAVAAAITAGIFGNGMETLPTTYVFIALGVPAALTALLTKKDRTKLKELISTEKAAGKLRRERKKEIQVKQPRTESLTRAESFTGGRTIKSTIAGVTFTNADGSSRQAYLQALCRRNQGSFEVWFEPFTYAGEPAARVMYYDECLGAVKKEYAADVVEHLEQIRSAYIIPSSFYDNGRKIYYADIYITFGAE